MVKFILGKKLGMSQVFDEKGNAIPVTVVEAGPCYVTQIRNKEKEGYAGVQIGFSTAKHANKSRVGHIAKAVKAQSSKLKTQNLRWLREFRVADEYKLGQEIKADVFKQGDIVKVSGISKGKGFAGVVKRHGFRGAPASHGTKHNLRAPGSIGSTFPERVLKGKKMAGRMGSDRITIKNLEIISVDVENNLIAIKGAVPGIRGSLLEIRS